MALMKGDIGSSNKHPVPFGPYETPSSKMNGMDPFVGLGAARDAQRAALSHYMAKTVQGVEQANVKDMGDMGDDGIAKETAYRRAQSRYEAGKRSAAQKNSGSDQLGNLNDLMASLMGGSNVDYRAEAARMFKPQYDYLTGLENAAKGRAKTSDTAVAQIYAALQQGIKDDAKPVGAIYDNAAAGVADAYKGGAAQIAKAQDDTAARTAAVMKKLGIEQAGPELFKENVADAQAAQQRLLSQNATEQAGYADTKKAALNDLVVQGQAAGLVGAEQRSNLQMQLADILAGYGQKRADLSSQEAKAAMDFQGNAQDQQQKQLELLMQQQQQDFENSLSTGQYDLARDKFDFERQQASLPGGPNGQIALNKLSPYEAMQAAAAQSYGNPTSTSNAVNAVEDAYRMFQPANGRPPANLQELLNYLRQRNPGAHDIYQLNNLASMLWDSRY